MSSIMTDSQGTIRLARSICLFAKYKLDFSLIFKISIVKRKTFLKQVDFAAKPTYWKPLYPPVKEKLGELLVSLTYHPAKNILTIVIIKAKNLKAKDINGKSGRFRPQLITLLAGTLHMNHTTSYWWSIWHVHALKDITFIQTIYLSYEWVYTTNVLELQLDTSRKETCYRQADNENNIHSAKTFGIFQILMSKYG